MRANVFRIAYCVLRIARRTRLLKRVFEIGAADTQYAIRNTSAIHFSRNTKHATRNTSIAFTLIEIMVVVAIMAIIMGMSIPFAKQAIHREALTQAVLDVQEVCGKAREKAIFQGSMADLVFNAKDASMNVSSHASTPQNPQNPDAAVSSSGP